MSIIIWDKRAFLPTLAYTDTGFFVDCDPVFQAELELRSLTAAIEENLSKGHPGTRTPTREQWPAHSNVLLAATGARSWKALAKHGAQYCLAWKENHVHLDMSKLDSKGRWEPDPEKSREFVLQTPLKDIVAVILEDAQTQLSV